MYQYKNVKSIVSNRQKHVTIVQPKAFQYLQNLFTFKLYIVNIGIFIRINEKDHTKRTPLATILLIKRHM